ncbi:MAG: FRG domain-containing protein [Phycisphaerae bacterium]
MKNVQCENWLEFERLLGDFYLKNPINRDRFVFRGQADAEWPLTATLDRYLTQFGIAVRDTANTQLLSTFAEQAAALGDGLSHVKEHELALLARHHGLPSRIMDWSRSPYVAAYFAFRDKLHDDEGGPSTVAVWNLNLDEAPDWFKDDIDIIDDYDAIRLIPRAIEQRSVFLDVRQPFEFSGLPEESLVRFLLPANERSLVLARLEGMGINARGLFRSFEAAADVASWRVREINRRKHG